jgi:hypothetical protein
MADITNNKAPTHTAYALKREGKRFGRWLEIGVARQDKDGSMRVLLDRLPVGGFTGHVHLSPLGVEPPPPPRPDPQRPAADEDEEFEG